MESKDSRLVHPSRLTTNLQPFRQPSENKFWRTTLSQRPHRSTVPAERRQPLHLCPPSTSLFPRWAAPKFPVHILSPRWKHLVPPLETSCAPISSETKAPVHILSPRDTKVPRPHLVHQSSPSTSLSPRWAALFCPPFPRPHLCPPSGRHQQPHLCPPATSLSPPPPTVPAKRHQPLHVLSPVHISASTSSRHHRGGPCPPRTPTVLLRTPHHWS